MAATEGMPLLVLEGVTKSFEGVMALQGVDFSVAAGELVCLIGPNGSGKTTCCNLICGFARPTTGAIRYRGESIVGLAPERCARLGIGRTFQIVQPFAEMTVLDNVTVGALFTAPGRRRSIAEARAVARATLEMVGLGAVADLPGKSLPLGAIKRLELARALATRPELLLLDEVCGGLLQSEVNEVANVIRDINRSGVTVLMIEHVMGAVMSLAQRVIVLLQGRKLIEGPPEVVANDPQVIESYLGRRRPVGKA